MKSFLTSKMLRKLSILSCLVGGLVVMSGYKQVSAASTDCYQQSSYCYADASDAKDRCYVMCSGIIACESSVCNFQFDQAVAQCDSDLETCLGS